MCIMRNLSYTGMHLWMHVLTAYLTFFLIFMLTHILRLMFCQINNVIFKHAPNKKMIHATHVHYTLGWFFQHMTYINIGYRTYVWNLLQNSDMYSGIKIWRFLVAHSDNSAFLGVRILTSTRKWRMRVRARRDPFGRSRGGWTNRQTNMQQPLGTRSSGALHYPLKSE